MMIKEIKSNGQHILFDQDMVAEIDESWFDPVSLQQDNAITGCAVGRGTTFFFNKNGHELVLRHYLRGGIVARLSRDRYFRIGLTSSRAWREWHLLAKIQELDLPAPRPVAARVVNHLITYSADIITLRIPDAVPLGEKLLSGPASPETWQDIGTCIAKFHNQGVFHADLNANNILLSGSQVFLADFDKGKLIPPKKIWQLGNMGRLKRSLIKLLVTSSANKKNFHFNDDNWDTLMQSYNNTLGSGK